MENSISRSDAEWYFRSDYETDRFYDIFFRLCRKYNVSWTMASEKEKSFIEEVTRVTYEIDRAKRCGESSAEVRPAFVS